MSNFVTARDPAARALHGTSAADNIQGEDFQFGHVIHSTTQFGLSLFRSSNTAGALFGYFRIQLKCTDQILVQPRPV
ncbi:uncharacterized protein IUM83_14386 [Phytophthora cinnamomi]|uniref:uncharacterized protein n=1 Tax=Phytophthora cinnamomi TaxID=4785 RepID=UPI00355A96B1|nr:hypothetical protein IUM83_14386 [Phytophthora cinnamomi]